MSNKFRKREQVFEGSGNELPAANPGNALAVSFQ